MPHHPQRANTEGRRRPETRPSPRRARSHCLEPSRCDSPRLSRPSRGPTASRSLLPDSDRVCSETPEASSRTQSVSPTWGSNASRSHLFHKAQSLCGRGLRQEGPCHPLRPARLRISTGLHHPKSKCAHTLTQLRSLVPLRPPACGDLLPRVPASAPAPALATGARTAPGPSGRTAPPNTCREDAESEESLADHGTLVCGANLRD